MYADTGHHSIRLQELAVKRMLSTADFHQLSIASREQMPDSLLVIWTNFSVQLQTSLNCYISPVKTVLNSPGC